MLDRLGCDMKDRREPMDMVEWKEHKDNEERMALMDSVDIPVGSRAGRQVDIRVVNRH